MHRYTYIILLSSLLLISNSVYTMDLDSLEQVTLLLPDTEEKVDNFLILGEAFVFVDKKKSLKYAYQAQELSEKLAYKTPQKQLYFNLGTTLIAFDTDSADYYLNLALDLAKRKKDNYLLARIYNAKGSIKDNKSKRREALLLYYEAEKYAIASNSIDLLANIYNNIGIALAYTSNKDAMSYFRKAYYTAKKKGMENQHLRAGLNLGVSLKSDKQLDSALFYLHEALELNKILNNNYLSTNIHLNLSDTYRMKGDLNKMKKYALNSLEAAKKINDSYGILISYQNLQTSALELGNYQKAIEYGDFVLNSSKPYKKLDHFIVAYNLQSKAYRALGDYKKALIYQDTVLIYQDSINTLEKQESLEELEKKYEVGKLKEKQLTQAKQAKFERRILYGVLVAMFFISFGAIRFYRISKVKTKLSKQLEAQTIELEQLDETKTRFFTNVSHELKTPLTLIINPIEKLLKRTNIDNESYFLLKTVKKHSYQLLDLTNQILELTKFDSNKAELNKTVVNPYQLIELLVAEFDSFAVSKDITIINNNELDENLFIQTDKYKLQTIIKNLVSNAIKFTPKDGKIHIKATEKNNLIEINITDTGRGIPQDQVSKIFDRYYQVTTSSIISEGGTGIGLSICQEYTQALGGTIEINSVWQEGTSFKIILPIETAIEPELIVTQSPKMMVSKTNLPNIKDDLSHILLVEDNINMQQYLHHILATSFNVHIANHGQEALEYLKNNENNLPDLIISDVMMPIMNGYQFLESCKNEPKWALIPFIMLTAVSTTTEKLKFLRLGIDDYILKPFVDDELTARIDNLLENATERKVYQIEQRGKVKATIATKSEIIETKEVVLTKEHQLWLEQVETIVKEKCGRFDFSVDMLAYDLSLSRSQTHRKIKVLTGLTPREYISNIRFEMARQLLQKESSMTIKAIAYTVGFKDEKYFSRKFKKHFGKNPSNF